MAGQALTAFIRLCQRQRYDATRHPRKEARPRNKAGVVFSILIPLLTAILLFVVIRAKLRGEQLPDFVIFLEALGFVVVILAGTWFLIQGVGEHRESEERYRQMAGNIQEIFWMIDAASRKILEVNDAYETITGRTRKSLMDNPTSYEEIIHPEDRVHVLARLDEATRTGKFDERFRITLPNLNIRWVRVHGFPVRNAVGRIWRLVGTAQDNKHAYFMHGKDHSGGVGESANAACNRNQYPDPACRSR